MKTTVPAKELKNGKMSLKMDLEMVGLLQHAVECRQIFDKNELEDPMYFLLDEAREKLWNCMVNGCTKVTLRKSEFFAMLTDGVTQYLDDPTKILLRDIVTPTKRLP